ncbi:hypothetical protein DWG18_02305 [Lysobacter sp. TY2-98]|uniref:hypothetical protein n=1 Tax=Lysobacter sp. TY2-98 TaxID=2290922 RepID=UPI000E2053C0|nr:hypothetical protein [Lysobacter sp. TY2-98]AXK71232.1 hypothetical protein DWG18_02305 [Lysobacter sp. TY2-98]
MLNKIATLMDQTAVRCLLGLVAICASLVLVLPVLALLSVTLHEPVLGAIGAAALAGLVAGLARLLLGGRFFSVSAAARTAIRLGLGAGVLAVAVGAIALPSESEWRPVIAAVAALGAVLLAGSVGRSPGPNNSSKPTPLRGAA